MSSQNTSIGSCPSHWKVVKFSSVAELKHGYQFRTTDFTEQGVKVLKITQIKDNGSIDISSCSFIDAGRLQNFENNIVKKGDILMALSGATIGKIGRYKSDEIVLQNYRVGNFLPLDENVLNKNYFYHFLTTENTYYQILANQNQSAQENVGKEDIHNMLVFLPPLPEQTAIASVLSSLDDKIDLLHRQNATLEKMAETLFRQWFVEEAKEEWMSYKLKDLVKHVKPGTNYQPKRIENGIPFLNVRNLSNGFLDLSDTTKISKEEYERIHKNWQPEENDLLISRIGTLGIVAVIQRLDLPVAVHYNMINIKPNLTSYQFLYFLLKSQLFQEKYLSNIRQSVQEYVAIEDTENIEISLPIGLVEFKNQESYFIDIYNKIKSNQGQINTLTSLRDNLLPKLMSGEIKVQS